MLLGLRWFVVLVFFLGAAGPVLAQPDGSVTHSTCPSEDDEVCRDDDVDASSVSCGLDGALSAHGNNFYGRVFRLCNEFDITDEVEVVEIDLGIAGAVPADGFDTQPVNVIIYELPPDYDGGVPQNEELFEVGRVEVALESFTPAGVYTVDFSAAPVVLRCDRDFMVVVNTPNGQGVSETDPPPDPPSDSHQFLMGKNAEGESGTSYAYFPECGDTPDGWYDISVEEGLDIHWVMVVHYDIVTTDGCPCEGPFVDCQSEEEGGYVFEWENTDTVCTEPALAIPDFDSSSMSDPVFETDDLVVTGIGEPVEDLDVFVDITHPFNGDLIIELENGGGTNVSLYDESGSDGDDILVIFDDEGRLPDEPFNNGERLRSIGLLEDFDGADADDTWTLRVADASSESEGTLNEWCLYFNFLLDVPDTGSGETVSASIEVPVSNEDQIRDLDVRVIGEHATPSDLDLELESPAGTTVILADNGLSNSPTQFDVRISDADGECDEFGRLTPSGSLADFDGEDLAGTWTLTLTDDATEGDVGGIRSFKLLVAPVTCLPAENVQATTSCEPNEVSLTWELPVVELSGVDVLRDGELLVALASDAVAYVDTTATTGTVEYDIRTNCTDGGSARRSIEVEHVSCCPLEALSAETDCDTGDVLLSWTLGDGVYDSYNVYRNGVEVASGVSGASLEYTDLAVDAGTHVYELEGVCLFGTTSIATVHFHAPFNDESDLVYAPEAVGGGVGALDSGTTIFDALEELAFSPLKIPALDYPCMPEPGDYSRLWVCFGTFPFAHAMTETEGTILAELVTGDTGLDDTIDHDPVPLYIEGADIWGFDLPTDFSDYDGIEAGTADGDDTFEGMTGLQYADLNVAALSNTYTQESGVLDEKTDQLVPTGTTEGETVDLGGAFAGTIWEDDGSGGATETYGTGVLYQAVYEIAGEKVANRIICASFELAGFDGNPATIVGRYIGALDVPDAPVADFQADVLEGESPLEVTFTDLSTDDPLTWAWDFGDGATSEEQNPVHEYAEDGTYTVSLTVANGGGCDTLVRTDYIVVGDDGPLFLRGDSDNNGVVFPILDALHVLAFGFTQGPTPECLDAADADGNNTLFPIIDALLILEYGFNNGPAPPSPGPDECGPDDDADETLNCLDPFECV